MPNLVVTNAGQMAMLNWCLQSTSAPESMTLHLYQNDYSPTLSSTVGSFTEASFTNYTSQTMNRASWGNAALVSGVATSVFNTTFTWSVGSTQTVYGWYLTGNTSGTLIAAQRFDSPKSYVNGDIISLTPQFTLIDQS